MKTNVSFYLSYDNKRIKKQNKHPKCLLYNVWNGRRKSYYNTLL